MRPYPHHYGVTFAFSEFLYPLHRPRSLQFGYHRSGVHGAYPVDRRGLKRLGVDVICSPVGFVNTAARSHTEQSYPLTILVWCSSLFHQFAFTSRTNDDSLSLIRPKLPLVRHRIEAPCRRNIVPKASHV